MKLKYKVRIAKELKYLGKVILIALAIAMLAAIISGFIEYKQYKQYRIECQKLEKLRNDDKKRFEQKLDSLEAEIPYLSIRTSKEYQSYRDSFMEKEVDPIRRWDCYSRAFTENFILLYCKDPQIVELVNYCRWTRSFCAFLENPSSYHYRDKENLRDYYYPDWSFNFGNYKKHFIIIPDNYSWIYKVIVGKGSDESAIVFFLLVVSVYILFRILLFLAHGIDWIDKTSKMKEPK